MTSRVSFLNLYKETLKRHLTSILIVTLAFIIHFVFIFMGLQNTLEYADSVDNYVLQDIWSLYSPNVANGIFAMIIGAFFAFDYFKYLHSRKESDFYDSLPIKRNKRFILNLFSGLGVFVVLLVITLTAEFLVVNLFGFGSPLIVKLTLWNMLCMIGSYLLGWTTSSLAFVMTGNLIVALLGIGAFSVYIPILINNLFPVFARMYFDTYYTMPVFTKFPVNEFAYYCSPVTLMYKMNFYHTADFEYWVFSEHKSYVIGMLFFILIVGFAAYMLFVKRPSEAAGRAMAFENANNVIRILITIPLTLYISVFLKSLSAYSSDAWLIFGVIFAGFIIHGLVEAIFEADIRAMFTKKRQLLLTYFICFGFLSIFIFDLLKYDDYVPKNENIEKVYVDINEMGGYSEFDGDGLSGDAALLALDAARELVNEEYGNCDDCIFEIVTFKYELKNGIEISRRYQYNINQISSSLNRLSETEDFKNDTCLLYTLDLSSAVDMYVDRYYSDVDNTIPENYRQKLVDAYLRDYETFSLFDHFNEIVLYRISMEYNNAYGYVSYAHFDVYETFVETTRILKELGFEVINEDDEVVIKSMELYVDEYGDVTRLDNPEALAKLKPYCIIGDYNSKLYNKDGYIHGWCEIATESGTVHMDVFIPQDAFEKIMK